MRLGHVEAAGKRKLGLPDTYTAYRWDMVAMGSRLWFAVKLPKSKRTRPPFRERWDESTSISVIVTEEEELDEADRYEAETGQCRRCFGRGLLVRYASIESTTWGSCGSCGGSGRCRPRP